VIHVGAIAEHILAVSSLESIRAKPRAALTNMPEDLNRRLSPKADAVVLFALRFLRLNYSNFCSEKCQAKCLACTCRANSLDNRGLKEPLIRRGESLAPSVPTKASRLSEWI
jgi:hypothetical protein